MQAETEVITKSIRKQSVIDILNSMPITKRAGAIAIPEGQEGTYKVAKSNLQKVTSKVFIIREQKIWRTE